MSNDLFWYAMTAYALVLLFFLVMTRREQSLNQIPFRHAVIGLAAGIVWPLTVLFFIVYMWLSAASSTDSVAKSHGGQRH